MTRALVVHVAPHSASDTERAPIAALEEAVGLTQAIHLEVVGAYLVKLRAVTPATHIGKGKVEEFAELVKAHEASLVVMDCHLSPLQQRNLETALACKVIDRTALILEIFGARARTAEGKLQVELASLTYQKSRLVRSWTHLERQRGGFGFLGGPGESQIEIDRRLIGERIDKIKKQLARVVKTRDLHRAKRRDVPYPIAAIVGYTNAGKSTLFNRLTDSHVLAKDMLFATLDPTIRALILPSGTRILLSDTVGFISNLPTELIAAFRATLEEVLEADVILHVRDAANPDSEAQKRDVLEVLKTLFGKAGMRAPMLEVQNKIDLLPEGESPLRSDEHLELPAIGVSAHTGEGCEALLAQIDALLGHTQQTYVFSLPHHAGKALAWLYRHAQVQARHESETGIDVKARLSASTAAQFYGLFEIRPERDSA